MQYSYITLINPRHKLSFHKDEVIVADGNDHIHVGCVEDARGKLRANVAAVFLSTHTTVLVR